MYEHVDRRSAQVEQLSSMETKLEDSLDNGILVASMEVEQLKLDTAEIKTLPDK